MTRTSTVNRSRNVRPQPDIPASHNSPTLKQLVRDAKAAEVRIAGLERTQRRTARVVLFENLDQAERIAVAVDVHKQSVAAFARDAGIEERRAQRVYKLAAIAGDIRKKVLDGEAKHGEDYECPSWKHFVPVPEEQQKTFATPDPIVYSAGRFRTIELAQERLIEIGRDIVRESQKGKKADKEVLAVLEHEQADLRQSMAELQQEPDRSISTSLGDEYETPDQIFQQFGSDCDLDVAASDTNTKCNKYFTKEQNGLTAPWSGKVWMNPPYSDPEPWCRRAWEYARTGGAVIALLPASTDTKWFHRYVSHAHITFLEGRITFVGANGPAKFPSMIVEWYGPSMRLKEWNAGMLFVTLTKLSKPNINDLHEKVEEYTTNVVT